MKQLASGLLLGALIWSASPAHAATTIDTTGFSLRWAENASMPLDMELLSDADGLARIGLGVRIWGVSWDTNMSGDGGTGSAMDHLLAATVRQGYRITSMTLSAVVNGSLYLQTRDCDDCVTTPGMADNSATLHWTVLRNGDHAVLPTAHASHVNGSQAISSTSNLSLDGTFELAVGAEHTVTATSPTQLAWEGWNWNLYTLQASSAVDMSNIVLSVQVAPVPEPSTYAMLLAGLGVAGWMARRRRA